MGGVRFKRNSESYRFCAGFDIGRLHHLHRCVVWKQPGRIWDSISPPYRMFDIDPPPFNLYRFYPTNCRIIPTHRPFGFVFLQILRSLMRRSDSPIMGRPITVYIDNNAVLRAIVRGPIRSIFRPSIRGRLSAGSSHIPSRVWIGRSPAEWNIADNPSRGRPHSFNIDAESSRDSMIGFLDAQRAILRSPHLIRPKKSGPGGDAPRDSEGT